jgi:hypothetical protein
MPRSDGLLRPDLAADREALSLAWPEIVKRPGPREVEQRRLKLWSSTGLGNMQLAITNDWSD